MIRRGPRRLRLSHGASSGDRGALCFFCHQSAARSPYRSPMPDVVGGRYVICGASCPDLPAGAQVFTDFGADWATKGAAS